MNATEWEQIKALFDAALQQPVTNRLSWLQGAAGDRRELYETVAQLLRHYEDSSWNDPRQTDSGPVFAPGETVADRFLILRLIARGGMGEVYEARDNQLHNVRVALKTLRLGLVTERQAHDRFKREVWVAREIAHEGICRMFDLVEHRLKTGTGEERVIPCLTMKLLEGESLHDYLNTRRPLSPEEALPIIRQIAQSLQVIHDRQIVHRDLKPSNVMLVRPEGSDSFRVVLIDFGLAKPLNSHAKAWETRSEQNQAGGAPYFVAPEVLRGEKGEVAADIYAFGLLIDEMVTRSPAFRYGSVEELYWRKLQGEPDRPSQRCDNLPAHWEKLILRCLSQDPALRPESAAALLAALEDSAPPGIQPVAPHSHEEPAPVLSNRLSVTRRVWIGTCASAVLASGAIGVLGNDNSPLIASLLIFPFENLIKHDDYKDLCSGLVEEVTRRLSYVQGLSVFPIPRSWNPQPGSMDKGRFSLKGSLHYIGGSVWLSVQLVENTTGTLVWTESFDHPLRDPLTLESKIADGVLREIRRWTLRSQGLASRIQSTVSGLWYPLFQVFNQGSSLPPQATPSNAAFDEYRLGRELWQQRTLPAALDAVGCFERAIRHDPNFALAYAAQADIQQTLLNYNYAPTMQLLSAALTYAEKAVALDGSLPECHVARAAALQNLWRWQDSGSSYQTAIKRHPKFARAYDWYAGLLMQFARSDEALNLARIGLELDPFHYPSHSNYGFYLWNAGKTREAARQLESVLARTDLIYAHNVLGQVYADLAASSPEPDATTYYLKSLREAETVRVRDMEAAGGADPGYLKWSDVIFVQAHGARKDRPAVLYYLDRLERGFKDGKISATAVAWAHAVLEDRRRALELLEYGLVNHEREMLYIAVTPRFRKLHGEPRFQRIVSLMKLV